ncbi:hypothetical protein [Arthrobacter silvisoli]|uniref:hypothetical protein n=1 Tax=Arthrobacter silvisoli TaxID=2291022 RepID=UPI000E20CCD4|nr:hypothetical protein [Arthrobacter silvisoli]
MKRISASMVHDGIQSPAHPLPRDTEEEQAKAGEPGDAPPRTLGGEPTGQPGTAGSKDPSGPAEEADDATRDDRRLTTKLSPSD